MNFLLEEDELTVELVFVQTFPCKRSDCRFCYLCHKCPTIVYIRERETGRRLIECLQEHRLDVIKEKVAPPVPGRFSSRDHRLLDVMVAIIKVGREELENKRYKTFAPRIITKGFFLVFFLRTKSTNYYSFLTVIKALLPKRQLVIISGLKLTSFRLLFH